MQLKCASAAHRQDAQATSGASCDTSDAPSNRDASSAACGTEADTETRATSKNESQSAPPQAASSATARKEAAEDMGEDTGETAEGEVCSVCLSAYDACDLLIRLPCEHLFHEQCISRWLQQDGSCPQCRFHVQGGFPPQRAEQVVSSPHSALRAGEAASSSPPGQRTGHGFQFA